MQAEPYSGVQRVLERIEDTLAEALACDDLMLDSTREQLADLVRLSNRSLALIGKHRDERQEVVERARALLQQMKASRRDKPSPTDYLDFGVPAMPTLEGTPREAYERVEEWFRSWVARPNGGRDYAETRAVHRARNHACWQLGCRATTEGNEVGGIGWLPLDVATYNALIRGYYSRISELAEMTDEQMDDISRIGPKRVEAIRVAIERYEMGRS